MEKGMQNESGPEKEKTDAEIFEEVRKLAEEEGWRFQGNFFQTDQTYTLVLSKEGEEDKKFRSNKPYPKIVDATGKARGIR